MVGRRVDKIVSGDYVTDKPYEEVWNFYAKGIEYKGKYNPNAGGTSGHAHGDSKVDYAIQYLGSGGGRSGIQAATFIRHDKKKKERVVIRINRTKGEEKTYITLISFLQ